MSSEIGRVGRPVSVRRNAACPPAAVVFVRRRRPRASSPFPGLFSCKGRGGCPAWNGRHIGADGGASRRSRHPAGARAAVGDLRAEAAAGLSGPDRRPSPSSRRSFLTRSSDCCSRRQAGPLMPTCRKPPARGSVASPFCTASVRDQSSCPPARLRDRRRLRAGC